jgi:hypothetical protein
MTEAWGGDDARVMLERWGHDESSDEGTGRNRGALGEETVPRSLVEEAGVAGTVSSGAWALGRSGRRQPHMSALCVSGLRERGDVRCLGGREFGSMGGME